MKVIAETVFHDHLKGTVTAHLEVEVGGERMAVSRCWTTHQAAYMTRERFNAALDSAAEYEQNACRHLIMREIERRIFG